MIDGEDQRFQDAQSAGVVDETMAVYDRAAPAEVRADWDRLYDIYTPRVISCSPSGTPDTLSVPNTSR